jgi:ferredoxin
MRRRAPPLAALVLALAATAAPAAPVERFPPPDFTDHPLPQTTTPAPAAALWDYLDVAALVGALALATYLALRRRSRRGLLVLTVASLLWFGFWRKGCVCSVGAIQNVALAAADPSYAIPFSAVAFFALPVLVTLFYGRTFCAAVCPLGAVQELVALRPLRVPAWLDQALGLVPFVYLGAAVLFAATGTTFLICSYDPFVGFFRLSAPQNMLVLGACFLVVGLFVGRPYCRYLCPYGALLGLCSRLAKRHVRIPPGECIRCRLCEEACPYGAIREPTAELTHAERARGRRRLAVLLALLPVLVGLGFVLGLGLAFPLARLHPTVRLAEYVRDVEQNPPGAAEDVAEALKPRNDAVEAFRNTGRPVPELHAEALQLRQRFRWLGGGLGAWVGLAIGVRLVALGLRRRRVDYEPDRANCVSCGRCYWYCPHEQVRQGLILRLPVVPAPETCPAAK